MDVMEIKTKCNVGDKVYILHLNKLDIGYIQFIITATYSDNIKRTHIEYEISLCTSLNSGKPLRYKESMLFKSKEGLINSL